MIDGGVPTVIQGVKAHAHAGVGVGGAHRTHWAHVAVVALHAICCGLPILASIAGLATSAALVGGVLRFHTFLHARELWLVAISAVLVAGGWIAERRLIRRTGQGVSPLFWISLACFAFNAAIVFGHRIAG
ncbi:MAG: hypothetical protein IV086_11915 [Hyphomonadaceae bacterium]|nr:MAG: hypothetical protein FD160_3890 [Caulobacteraceae bacterium]MBT9446397.1 hypothetical protein [Hyphomonadaceae bacterium]TPW04932.1 MAG: hypothetical protein FD124_2395 [Alphaproteobacteria bacterium]